MTDRIRTLTVLLDSDYRDDDAEPIVNAISMISGVADVHLGDPVDAKDWSARISVARDLRTRINRALAQKVSGAWRYNLKETE